MQVIDNFLLIYYVEVLHCNFDTVKVLFITSANCVCMFVRGGGCVCVRGKVYCFHVVHLLCLISEWRAI